MCCHVIRFVTDDEHEAPLQVPGKAHSMNLHDQAQRGREAEAAEEGNEEEKDIERT